MSVVMLDMTTKMSQTLSQNCIALFCLIGLQVESKFVGESIKVDTSRGLCPYHVLKTSSMISCIDVCVSYTDCEAVNYNTKNMLCELFVPTEEEYDLNHGVKNRLYIDMAMINQIKTINPCYERPCGPGERCIPDRGHSLCETPDLCPSMYLVSGACGVPDSQIMASSGIVAKSFRLDSNNDWCAEYEQANESIQVEFRSEKIVKEVITQGSGIGRDEISWVTAYTIEYSIDCVKFRYVMNSGRTIMVFEGNTDRKTQVRQVLPYRLAAKCVKLRAIHWSNNICMRLDFIGCNSGS